MISKNLFFIVVALVFLLVALSYAENTQAINAIEARELEQFKQLTAQNDENRTQIDTRDDNNNNNNNNETDQGDDVIVKGDDEDSTEDSSEDSSSSTGDDDIEPTENVDEPTTTDETEPTTTPTAETDAKPDGIDLPANEDGQPMKVLINQLIDDLNRRTKQGAGGDATLTPRTHKKRPWGGREHNRPRW